MNTPDDNNSLLANSASAKRRTLAAGRISSVWQQHWQQRSEPLRQRWLALAPRERQGLRWALLVLGLLIVVMLGVRPAWHTLQEAPAQLNQLEEQLQKMKQLASEAQLLRNTPVVSMTQSMEALKAACDRLGAVGKLNQQSQQATVTLNGITPEALTEWLREVRTVGRMRVTEAKLTRTGTTYSGTVVVTLGGGSP